MQEEKLTHSCTQLKCRGDARVEARSSGDRKRRLWRLFLPDSRRFLPGSRLFRPSIAVIGLPLSLCLLFLRAAGCGMDGIGGPTSSAVERAQVRGSRSVADKAADMIKGKRPPTRSGTPSTSSTTSPRTRRRRPRS